MAARPVLLDPEHPVHDLLEALGLTQAQLAERRGIRQPSVNNAKAAGGGVSVRVLAALAKAAGRRLELRLVEHE